MAPESSIINDMRMLSGTGITVIVGAKSSSVINYMTMLVPGITVIAGAKPSLRILAQGYRRSRMMLYVPGIAGIESCNLAQGYHRSRRMLYVPGIAGIAGAKSSLCNLAQGYRRSKLNPRASPNRYRKRNISPHSISQYTVA
jgi:hypothetical protein